MKTMKKLAYLLGLVMVLTIGFTSCEKGGDDDPIVPILPTLTQPAAWMGGTWVNSYETQRFTLDENSIIFEVKNQSGNFVKNTNYENWEVKNGKFTAYKADRKTVVGTPINIQDAPTDEFDNDMTMGEIIWVR